MSSGVDIETDRAFQERFWIAVRIGWIAMAGVLLLAVLGFTGGGGSFSEQTLRAGSSRVELPAISRWAASDTMTITIPNPAQQMTVTVPAAFGDVFTIESVNPQPESVSAGSAGDEFVFAFVPGSGEASIDFSVRAARPAWRRGLGTFVVDGESSETTAITVLP